MSPDDRKKEPPFPPDVDGWECQALKVVALMAEMHRRPYNEIPDITGRSLDEAIAEWRKLRPHKE